MRLNRVERFCFSIAPKFLLRRIIPRLKKFHFIRNTAATQTPISFELWYNQFVKGHCSDAYWPVHFTSIVSNPNNIYCGIETSPGFSPGNYIQAMGKIYIGDYTQIAPNVGIITGNHDLHDNSKHIIKDVTIGKYCWIGMGAIIMPGVQLGDYTIVGAGSIVTKSFVDGYCVIGGNPAKEIKKIEQKDCIFHQSKVEYNGYIKHEDFEAFRKQNLYV
jgi:acetyltransferase-like isoleucine patch superfamily enzyme